MRMGRQLIKLMNFVKTSRSLEQRYRMQDIMVYHWMGDTVKIRYFYHKWTYMVDHTSEIIDEAVLKDIC